MSFLCPYLTISLGIIPLTHRSPTKESDCIRPTHPPTYQTWNDRNSGRINKLCTETIQNIQILFMGRIMYAAVAAADSQSPRETKIKERKTERKKERDIERKVNLLSRNSRHEEEWQFTQFTTTYQRQPWNCSRNIIIIIMMLPYASGNHRFLNCFFTDDCNRK